MKRKVSGCAVRTAKGEAVLKALKDFPDLSSHQLGRYLSNQHPLLFKNEHYAHTLVQYYRGARGEKYRKLAVEGWTKGSQFQTFEDRKRLLDAIPEGKTEFVWREIPITSCRTLVLADIHARFHDKPALTAALEYGVKQECSCVVFLGDLCDFYELSKFDRNPRMDNLLMTLQCGFGIIKTTRRLFPKARIIFKFGNHDERWNRYIRRKGQELCGMKISSLEWLFQHPSAFDVPDEEAEGLNLEVVEDPVPLTIGALYLWHGHEYQKGTANSPVNAARNAFMKTLDCCVVGHSHQTSSHAETCSSGKVISTWSIGCLCNLHPEYAPVNRLTSHGFAIVDYMGKKNFRVNAHKIIQGEVY